MANIACTVIGQKKGTGSTYTTTNTEYVGFNYNNEFYPYVLKFTTGNFAGQLSSITFNLSLLRGKKENNYSTGTTVRYALCKSDSNISSYSNTASAVTDPNQITSGRKSFSGLSSAYTTIEWTLATNALSPNTTYYLILWGDNTAGYSQDYCVANAASNHSISLAYVNTYQLTITQGTGSTITVKRNGTALANGATITYGDVLTVTFGANTGYNLGTHTVNGATFTSGNTHTVTGAVTVVSSASLKTFTLYISQGTGSTITVKRGSTTLTNGAKLTYGDSLTISFSSNTGYIVNAHTVNGATFTSGGSHTVTGDVSVASTGRLRSFTMLVTEGTGSKITVERTSSPVAGATTGVISGGTVVYYFDEIKVTFSASTGYNLATHTLNGESWNGGTHKVEGAVELAATATLKTFTLSISAGTGSTITVKRDNTTLSNGTKITYGDKLTVTFGVSTGYNLGTHTVNKTTFTSGGTHTVTGDVAVVSTASLKTFTLSISQGTGSTITVKRSGTALSNGSTITYGDVLTVTFTSNTGYNLGTHTVNGSVFASGNTHAVTGAVSVVSTATVKSFKLSINVGAGSTITVNRTSSPKQGASTGVLSNDATIYYSDVLKITFGTSTGYDLGTHTVNNTSFTSGNTHTVTGAVSVVSTASLKTFTLSISQGAKSTITVKRNGSVLANGAKLTYGDSLSITFATATGYDLTANTVNGNTFTSGNTHNVTDNVAVVSKASPKAFSLSISAGTGSTITVKRNGTVLSNGSTIYYDEALSITFGASAEYDLGAHTVNGVEFSSGDIYVVTGNTSVVSTASLKVYKLTIVSGTGFTVTVKRTASSQGSTGNLTNGAILYSGDKLTVTYTASSGYQVKTATLNGVDIASGASHTVGGDVTVIIASTLMGVVYIDDGSGFVAYQIYIDNGSGWDMYAAYIDNGSSWDMCN